MDLITFFKHRPLQAVETCFVFQPEKRRHQENPGLALGVVSLDKVTGNTNLKELYVRVGDDGHVRYVDVFRDGSYVDLFELREYKPVRMSQAQKKKADAGGDAPLQPGRKYLYSVGRTNQLFGEIPADVVNGCIRGDDGGVKLFPTP